MDRMTKIDHQGWYVPGAEDLFALRKRGTTVDRLAAYENTGLDPKEIEGLKLKEKSTQMALQAACSVLEQYKKYEAEGRLVVLPCKFGDPLYRIRRFKRGKNWTKEAVQILSTSLTMNNVANVLFGDVMGKTVFLTREEAEAALRKEEST